MPQLHCKFGMLPDKLCFSSYFQWNWRYRAYAEATKAEPCREWDWAYSCVGREETDIPAHP